jgi:hypothetical protein
MNSTSASFESVLEDFDTSDTLGVLLPEQIMTCMPEKDTHSGYDRHTWCGYQAVMRNEDDTRVPFGVMPRLLIAFINARALMTNCQTVNLGSVHNILLACNMPLTGKNIFELYTQAKLLSKTEFSYTACENNGAKWTTEALQNIRFIRISQDERLTAELSTDYFEQLKRRGVRVSLKAMSALAESCLAVDVYTWFVFQTRELYRCKQNMAVFPSVKLLQNKFRTARNTDDRPYILHTILLHALYAVSLAVPAVGQLFAETDNKEEITIQAALL